MNNVAVPQVKIIEQPSSKGTRFRYECEGRFSNNISGASGKKSFPTIRVSCTSIIKLIEIRISLIKRYEIGIVNLILYKSNP
jgi:hypothetical protein